MLRDSMLVLSCFALVIAVGCGHSQSTSERDNEAVSGAKDSLAPLSEEAFEQPTGVPGDALLTAPQSHQHSDEKSVAGVAAEPGRTGPASVEQAATESGSREPSSGSFRFVPQLLPPTRPPADVRRETYAPLIENRFERVSDKPLSTFSIDVDTASYTNVRRYLESSQVPPADAVRLEELINYFPYEDAPPTDGRPFAVHTQVASCPWAADRQLVRIGLKGQEVEAAERQPANLVFLIDVSGSMRTENKLPLVKRSLHRLLEELGDSDRVSIVTYANGAQVLLPSTSAKKQHQISQAIDSMHAGGSTNGSQGLQMAYNVARDAFVQHGTNRVILCSDGDFNVGITSQDDLVDLISRQAQSGVFLSVLGFGVGNYRDNIAEALADNGNGNYAYIDSYSEARKVLIEQMTGTLETIAKDVKIQVEFNPANVAAYRLIGYENRKLAAEDFRNDRKDAGEIGAGHSVTALYEVIPLGSEIPELEIPQLKYQTPRRDAEPREVHTQELLTVRLRYKLPHQQTGMEFTHAVPVDAVEFQQATADLRFAAAVAAFGMMLRDSESVAHLDWSDVHQWARTSLGPDENGYRNEFLDLITRAGQLVRRTPTEQGLSMRREARTGDSRSMEVIARETSGITALLQRDEIGRITTFLIVVGLAYSISVLRP